MNIVAAALVAFLLMQHGDARRKGKSERIIHGRLAMVEEFPYQVSLELMYMHMCGGSIIHPRLIISAAHCMSHLKGASRIPPTELRVRVGTSIAERGGVIHNVQAVVPHELYEDSALVDSRDIGLILLERPIRFTAASQPVRLPRRPPATGQLAWVTGYGSQLIQQRKLRRNPRQLMAVELPVYETRACALKLLKMGATVAPDMICAGRSTGHQDACKGDSGGPMVIGKVLYGITAWGIGCGQEGTPGVYTDLSQYRDWLDIHSTILLSGNYTRHPGTLMVG